MIDDQALVSRILDGDAQAFRILIRQNQRLVSHMVARVVEVQEDQEEICQDVFLKVHDKLGEFNFQSKLSTWIATIAYRHAINHLRKKKPGSVDISNLEGHLSLVTESHSDGQELADVEEQLVKLIELLPVQYKMVLTLYHLEDKSYEEIGQITGMPEGTVKNYLFRARQILKEKAKTYLGKDN